MNDAINANRKIRVCVVYQATNKSGRAALGNIRINIGDFFQPCSEKTKEAYFMLFVERIAKVEPDLNADTIVITNVVNLGEVLE